jgi:adenosine/AMP kinase
MELQSVSIQPDLEGLQIIIAQSHFIKTVEDVYECLMNSTPSLKFGIAFCEASGPCLVRHQGNESKLEALAADYAYKIGSGHSLVVLIQNAYPINVLPHLRAMPELVNIYCATANPIEVVIAETELGRAILGIVDGHKPKGIEEGVNVQERKRFLRDIGYKL